MLVYTKYLIAVVFNMPDSTRDFKECSCHVPPSMWPSFLSHGNCSAPSVLPREKTKIIFYRLLTNEMQ